MTRARDNANLSPTIADARMPNLTGAITTVEGAVATTITDDAVTGAKIENNPTIAGNLTVSGDIVPSSALSNRNMIINGGMQVWQRATTTTDVGGSSGVFPAVDRFKVYAGNTAGRLTMSQSTDTPDGFGSSVKFDCTTADASTAVDEEFIFVQPIEGQNLQQMAKGVAGAKSVTLSFYAKGTAKTYGWEFVDHDTGGQRHIANTFTVTTSWQRFSFVIPGDTTGAFDNDNNASASLYFWLLAGDNMKSGTAATSWQALLATERAVGIGNFFDADTNELFITGVQLELGSNATPFEHRSYGDELARCERYYYNFIQTGVNLGMGGHNTDTTLVLILPIPTTMRDTPSLEIVNGTNYWRAYFAGVLISFDTFLMDHGQPKNLYLYATVADNDQAGKICTINYYGAVKLAALAEI